MAEGGEIAIIAAGCRFPGADSLDEFWRVLVNSENHVKDIPPERWKTEAFYSEDKDAPGKIYVKKAGLLNGYDEFDPSLFGISEAEAERIDPQQRYVLECVHMALEDGGIPRADVSGTQTGVYIGCMNDDYKGIFKGSHADDTSYSATGFTSSIIAARVSYVFNLQGPCLTLDTACSSALVAVHLGAQAILTGDCEMAVCGGVSSIISPETFIPLCRARMMSSVGQCQTFCDTADGYARGEGCGVVILKKLDQAIKDENKIWALVKTGSNQDGRTAQPITSPSAEQQYKLLELLYSVSGIDPSSIQYIEAHGTGTPAGDPVEANTLGRFFSKHRKKGLKHTEKLLVGSVKTNIGHTESAAGVAGLIKILLMIKHGKVVPSLHLKADKSNINPAIQLDEYDMDIATEVKDWTPNKVGDRIGCVNSFGFGGSNCHAILVQKEAFVCPANKVSNDEVGIPLFVTLSAKDNDTLITTLEKFKQDIQITTDSLTSISYTSTCLRDHFQFRLCFAATSLLQLKTQAMEKIVKDNKPIIPMNVVFVYSGVGTTWTGMCSELINTDRSFRIGVERVDQYLQPLAGISMLAKFADPNSDYADPFVNHVAIFATQVALTEMWRNLGIKPDAIVGQSVGEVAAAYASGALDLKSAVDVIYYRSKLLANCTGGSMMVVKNLVVSEVEQICDYYERKVTIAVYSSPVACTLSGETEIMTKIKADVHKISEERSIDIFIKDIPVQCAYHCHKVESCLPQIRQSLQMLQPNVRHTNIISTVTGTVATEDEFQTGDYWARNIREPVLLYEAIASSSNEKKNNVFVEIGPKQILRAHINDIFKGNTTICLPSMNYRKELQSKSTAVVELYENGATIAWNQDKDKPPIASIPTYAFKRKKILHIPDAEKRIYQGLFSSKSGDHMFVQRSVKEGKDFQVMIGKQTTAFVFDHFMSGTVLVPGATYVEAAIAISKKTFKLPIQELMVSVDFENTLTPKEGKESEIDCKVTKSIKGLEMTFLKENRVLCVAQGLQKEHASRKAINIESLKENCTKHLSKEEVYAALEKFNFQYGPSMSLIQHAWCSETECLAALVIPSTVVEEFSNTHIHPAVVDSIFQMFGILKGSEANEKPVFPKGLREITITRQPQQRMFCYAVVVGSLNKQAHFNALLLDLDGNVICEIRDFFTQEIDTEHGDDTYTYSLEWDLLTYKEREKDLNTSEKNVLVWGTENIKPFLQSVCKGFIMDFFKLNLGDKDPCVTFSENIENLKQRNFHAILFVPFVDFELTASTTKETYWFSKRTMLCLKGLLIALNKKSMKIPFFVVTKNTQVITGRHQSVNSLCGSELWGMVRSAAHESIYPDIRLVDLDPAYCDKASFEQILYNCFPDASELRIEGSLVYTNKLKARKPFTNGVCQKRIVLEDTDKAYLKSAFPDRLDNPYYEIVDENQPTGLASKDLVQLRLTSSCIHSTAIYPVTTEDKEEKYSIWPELSAEGFQTLSLEGEGCVPVAKNSKRTSLEGTLYYYCCPINVATYIDIPRKFVFKQSAVLSYVPGLLTSSVILCNMSEIVIETSFVCLYAEEQIKYCQRLVQTFLEKRRKCSVYHICEAEVVNRKLSPEQEKLAEAQCLIVLRKLGKRELKCLLAFLPEVKQIVSISQFISKHVRRWLAHTYPRIVVSWLRTESLFHEDRLTNIMPLVRDVLNRYKESICPNENLSRENDNKIQRNPLALPCNQVSILDCNNTPSLLVKETQLFRQNGCYIVIGGLTGLGWIVMQWIAKNGGGYLRSISRRKPTDDQTNSINRLMNETQCCIKSVQADISDLFSLKTTIKDLQTELHNVKIKGIINGAGVLSDCLLFSMSEEQLEKVIVPKILGSLNLHIATEHLVLDFFVMHSSIVSLIGNIGQCNYGAGNAFIDALAHYRRSRNLVAQSINWGPLSVGMLKDSKEIALQLQKKGMSALQPDDIKKCMKHVLISNDVQITCGSFNWSLIGMNFVSTKLNDLIPHNYNARNHHAAKSYLAFELDYYHQSNDNEKENLLFDLIKVTVCQEFEIRDKSSLSTTSEIKELGVDSFAAMSFVNTIFDLTGCRVPITMLLSDDTTIEEIITYLKENIRTISYSTSVESTSSPTLNPSSSVSFMERDVLLAYTRNPKSGQFIRVFDIELEGFELEFDIWQKILQHVVLLNHELHKYYIVNEHDCDAVMVSEENLNVEVESISFNAVGNNDPRDEHVFDLTNQLPIKFQIAQDRKCTILRIILHAVVTDLASITLISKDINRVSSAILKGEQLPERTKPIYIAPTIHAIVNQKSHKAKMFWSKQVENIKEPITLGKGEVIYPLDTSCFRLIKGSFPSDIAAIVLRFLQKKIVTTFQFFMSVYQLFLYMETTSSSGVIPVISPTDMRIHSKDLVSVVGRCFHYVPFIADFREKRSFRNFLAANAKTISLAVENSAYPLHMIQKEILLPEMQQNIGRHIFILDNMTELGELLQNHDINIRLKNLWHIRGECETVLYISYGMKAGELSYDFGYNSAVYNKDKGDELPTKLMWLMKRCINGLDEEMLFKEPYPSTRKLDIYRNVDMFETNKLQKQQGETSGQPNHKSFSPIDSGLNKAGPYRREMENQLFETILKSGIVRKQTRHGLDHKIQLTFKREMKETSKQASYMFEWANSGNHKRRTIPLKFVREVECWPNLNGSTAFVIHLKKRKYVMKTDTQEEAEEWMAVIQAAVNGENVMQTHL